MFHNANIENKNGPFTGVLDTYNELIKANYKPNLSLNDRKQLQLEAYMTFWNGLVEQINEEGK